MSPHLPAIFGLAPKKLARVKNHLDGQERRTGHVRARLSIVHDVELGARMAGGSRLNAEAFIKSQRMVGLARAKPTVVAAGDRNPPRPSQDSHTFGRPDDARARAATASGDMQP